MLKPAPIAMLLAVLPMAAQARPPLRPQRDVVVQYRVTGSHGTNQSSEVTIHYTAQGQRMRVEPAGRPSYMIVDRTADRMDVVMPAQRVYMDVPYDPRIMKFEDKNVQFTPRGSDTVAGLRCSVYQVQSQGGSGQICLTDDGVMLRAEGQGSQAGNSLHALRVSYAPQPASLFEPPAGFRKLDARNLPPAGGAHPQR